MQRGILRLARFMAIVGGIVLSALILIICVSILGRTLNTILHLDWVVSAMPGLSASLLDLGVGSVRGDFELVEAGMAFAIFAFLPLTQVTAGHATVDIFTSWVPKGALRWMRAVIEVMFAIALLVIAFQLFEGLRSKISSGQTTLLLEFPVWWSYAGSVVGATVAAGVAVFMAWTRIVEAVTGRVLIADDLGTEL